ncbi:MAG: stage II sporulation protein M [Cytophagaceae bacterium]|jgi:uncharacterized membrane protein SpoIIM required for sporulation|nr:stage II sporulation protein M [Cytophagaceae bacterium]
MKESFFIKQNIDKWRRLEKHLDQTHKNPDTLVDQFIQVSEDLSYAQTYYKNRSVRLYLNDLARQLYSYVYKNRRSNKRDIIFFWKEELPKMMWDARKELLLSFCTLCIAVSIGIFSSIKDAHFVNSILGDDYIAMTEANIANNDPMAVYKSMNEWDMYFKITLNNIRVDFLTFASGLLLGIGSLFITLYNGIMIGTFQFFFYEKGLLQESMLAIWLHGTLEIGGMVIATTAGLRLGSGLLFPGTFTRLQAFQRSAKQGFKILMGTLPITAFAAIIESFMTRYTNTPDIIRGFLILLSLFFLIGYFVVLPWYKNKTQSFSKWIKEDKVPINEIPTPSKENILTETETIQIAMHSFHQDLSYRIGLKLMLLLSAAATCTILYEWNSYIFEDITIVSFSGYLNNSAPWYILLTIGIAWTSMLTLVQVNSASLSVPVRIGTVLKAICNAGLTVVLLLCTFELFFPWNLIVFIPLSSYLMAACSMAVQENKFLFSNLIPVFSLLTKNIWSMIQIQVVLLLFGSVYFVLLNSFMVYFISVFIHMNIPKDFIGVQYIYTFIDTFLILGSMLLLSSILYWGPHWKLFSCKEIQTATYLKKKIIEKWA